MSNPEQTNSQPNFSEFQFPIFESKLEIVNFSSQTLFRSKSKFSNRKPPMKIAVPTNQAQAIPKIAAMEDQKHGGVRQRPWATVARRLLRLIGAPINLLNSNSGFIIFILLNSLKFSCRDASSFSNSSIKTSGFCRLSFNSFFLNINSYQSHLNHIHISHHHHHNNNNNNLCMVPLLRNG